MITILLAKNYVQLAKSSDVVLLLRACLCGLCPTWAVGSRSVLDGLDVGDIVQNMLCSNSDIYKTSFPNISHNWFNYPRLCSVLVLCITYHKIYSSCVPTELDVFLHVKNWQCHFISQSQISSRINMAS